LLYKFLRWCPGAAGLFLRQRLYPRYVKECGRNVLFGRFVDLGNDKKNISIGAGVVFNDFVTIQCRTTGDNRHNLIIGDNVFIGTGTTISLTNADITIQAGSNLGSECVIQSDKPVLIEENVLLAAFCEIGKMLFTGVHSEIAQTPQKNTVEKTTIVGHGCWLGVRAKVEAGNHIGFGTIVGAHSTVITDLPDHVVAIGSPAEVLRKRVSIKDIGT